MKPAMVKLGQLWKQTMRSGRVRVYVVVAEPVTYATSWPTAPGLQATLLDLESGSQRSINAMRLLEWHSWDAFEP